MAPITYKTTRENASTALAHDWIDDRPYYPLLKVDVNNAPLEMALAAQLLLSTTTTTATEEEENNNNNQYYQGEDLLKHWNASLVEQQGVYRVEIGSSDVGGSSNGSSSISSSSSTTSEVPLAVLLQGIKVERVLGGITNQLFKISGLPSPPNTVLLRIFGGEGLMDRDVENSNFAALCRAGMAPTYWGRFLNGRLEGWLEFPFRALQTKEMRWVQRQLPSQMARLHGDFNIPDYLLKTTPDNGSRSNGNDDQQRKKENNIALWDQLHTWMSNVKAAIKKQQQEMEQNNNNTNDDASIYAKMSKEISGGIETVTLTIPQELEHVKTIVSQDAAISFCHNDLLAANIMYNEETHDMQLIDFEYGGINYVAFDIANHWNEYAGGTDDGIPNYNDVPTLAERQEFIDSYNQSSIYNVTLQEVESFVLVNHLYWGIWAANQAFTEGCDEFDYVLYASNRFRQYFIDKQQQQQQKEQDTNHVNSS